MKVSLYDIAGDPSTCSTRWNSEELNDPLFLSVDFKMQIDLLCFFKAAKNPIIIRLLSHEMLFLYSTGGKAHICAYKQTSLNPTKGIAPLCVMLHNSYFTIILRFTKNNENVLRKCHQSQKVN